MAHTPDSTTPDLRPHVVIVGGGFGGVRAARGFKGKDVRVTLIDRTNHHLFQPLLYQVAMGMLSPGQIAPALRSIMSDLPNVTVRLAEVHGIDLQEQLVHAHVGDRQEAIHYDTLIVAAGATHSYFGNDQWAPYAPGLKSLDDARRMRSRVLAAFELAEQATCDAEREAYLTFAVVGGGPTGVELAGQIAQIAHSTLRGEYRNIDSTHARVVIVNAAPHVLMPFDAKLQARAERDLGRLHVEVLASTMVTEIDENGITAHSGDETIMIPAKTVVWAAGVTASPLARMLAEAGGGEVDRSGRLTVTPELNLPGYENVYAIGDMIALDGVPGVAQPAIQEGKYVAKTVLRRLAGTVELAPFQYKDKGSLATIGKTHAVAEIKGFKLVGFPAFLIWGLVHIAYLVGWGNRFGAMARWTWSLLARNRRERLISTAAIEEADAARARLVTAAESPE
jgi:NADH dehydrogenase